MTAVLDVANVSLVFGGIKALDDVSLAVEQSELMAIVGPNGAGKTSLLNCITGAYRASAGRIAFKGADITNAAAHTAAKRGIARTFQHNELFPQLTTLENLLLGRQAVVNYDLLSAGFFLGAVGAGNWSSAKRSKPSSSSSSSNPTASIRWEICPTGYRRSSGLRGPSPPSPRWCCWTSPPPVLTVRRRRILRASCFARGTNSRRQLSGSSMTCSSSVISQTRSSCCTMARRWLLALRKTSWPIRA